MTGNTPRHPIYLSIYLLYIYSSISINIYNTSINLSILVDVNETIINDTTSNMNNNNNETNTPIDPEELSAREKNYKHVLLQVNVYLSILLAIYLSFYQSIYLSIYLSIYQSINQSTIDPEELSAREKNFKHVLLQVDIYPSF